MNIPAPIIQAANAYARENGLEVVSIFDHDHVIQRKVNDAIEHAMNGSPPESWPDALRRAALP